MTCRYRSSYAGAALLALTSIIQPALAGDLPPVKASASNAVAECATPGRLMSFLRDNNPALAPKFNKIAAEYMRHGESLGLRWDYAFFQMLLETGYLKFTGDVKVDQNNFAGLGATGKGVRGESFKDVSTGVRAHIEHLLMYSGTHVESPVAERTRNVQEWGVLVPWQKSMTQPITYTQLAKQWAPGSRRYASDMASIAQRFFEGPCLAADPAPELIAEVRGEAGSKAKSKPKTAEAKPKKDNGEGAQAKAKDVADRAIDEQRTDGSGKKSALGAKDLAVAKEAASETQSVAEAAADEPRTVSDFAPQKAQPPVKIINAESEAPEAADPAAKTAAASVEEKAKPAAPEKSAKPDVKSEAKAEAKAEPKADAKSAPKTDVKASGNQNAGSEQKSTKVATLSVPGVGGQTTKPEKKAPSTAQPQPGKCRVWTASYGGSKAIIIKAVVDKTTNYTVLDVNEGAERREADAYIDAYAKGGEKVGEFSSQPQALEKAFELCPEG